jgi:hypothetical protein
VRAAPEAQRPARVARCDAAIPGHRRPGPPTTVRPEPAPKWLHSRPMISEGVVMFEMRNVSMLGRDDSSGYP